MSMTTMEYYDKNVESNGTYVPVERYVDEYCKALTENYKQDSMPLPMILWVISFHD